MAPDSKTPRGGWRYARSFLLLCIGAVVSEAAAIYPFGPPVPVFPLNFEQSGAVWIAHGPGYELALKDGGAVLALSNGRGPTSVVGL
jgi:hypothetical protein